MDGRYVSERETVRLGDVGCERESSRTTPRSLASTSPGHRPISGLGEGQDFTVGRVEVLTSGRQHRGLLGHSWL